MSARRWRSAIGIVIISALLVGVAATPAWASDAQKNAWALAADTAADARTAAAKTQLDPDPTATATDTASPNETAKPTPSPSATSDPVTSAPVTSDPAPPVDGRGSIAPDTKTTLDAASLGATVGFSGHKISEKLSTTVSALPDVSSSVASQLSATVLTTPFVVSAVSAAGKSVTSFPADPTIKTVKNGPDIVTAVDPGVALSIAVPAPALASVDPSTVRIVTRESAAAPWVELPSFYDKVTGTVKGESDHLSQFAVIGTPFVVPAGPKIVLDPDDDVAHTTGPDGPATELPLNVALANQLAAEMTTMCHAVVTVTRPVASPAFLSRSIREGIAAAANPDVTLTVAFDALQGSPWGNARDGGSKTYTRGGAADNALQSSLVSQLPGYTGRPSKATSEAGLPYSQFAPLPGAVAHLETLYIDHNYDRPVIDNGFSSIVDGVATGVGAYLNGAGFNCVDPVTGGWPTRPSAATLAAWKALGFHNNQTYGGDPVSFSTGNLLEAEPVFTLKGNGGSTINVGLNYNSQDGRESRVGTGWSFGIGARAQRFIDGGVMIVQGDGASDMFEPDGHGGYTTSADVHETLAESGAGTLTLTATDGTVSVFDASGIDGIGQLDSVTDATGNGYRLSYGAVTSTERFVPVTAITSTDGQVITVSSDASGHITGFTHPDGRVWTLAYSAAGDLATITAPDGGVRTFTYDGDHQLLTAMDATGVTYLKNQYDSSGRVVKQWDANANLRTFSYDSSSTTYVNNLGQKTVFGWDAEHRITSVTNATGGVEKFAYDKAGNTTSHTDQNGNLTRYSYDAGGNVLKQTDPSGAVTTHTYTSTGVLKSTTDEGGVGGAARTTTYDVNPAGLVTAAHLPGGGTVTLAYDATGNLASTTDQAGRVTHYAYDAHGNATRLTDPAGQVSTSVYDSSGRVVRTTDPSGAIRAFVWDSADRLVKTVNPVGAVQAYTYDSNGHVLTSTDALGQVTKYSWDDRFNLTSVTTPNGGVTKSGYDAEDNVIKITDPTGAKTTRVLDDLGRATTVTDADGKKWLSQYDAVGQLVASTDPAGAVSKHVYDSMGNLTKTVDPTGAATTTTYDQVGRTAKVTDALGGVTQYGYTVLDQLATVTDQTGAVTRYGYDAVGNQISSTDRRGQKSAQSYDAAGRLISQTDPAGASTAYAYDVVARTISTTDPDGGTLVKGLDLVGNVVSQTDQLGRVSRANYDALARTTSTTDPAGHVTTATYDDAGNLATMVNPLGAKSSFTYDLDGNQLTQTSPLGVTAKYAYDPLGQLTTVTQASSTPDAVGPSTTDANVTTGYKYTAAGLLAQVTDPNGHSTSYGYDSRGLQTSATNPLGISTHTTYDVLGRPVALTNGNGATTSTSYTARSDVSQVQYPDGATVSFEYDSEQHPIVMTDSVGTTGWSYDATGRQVSQTDPNGKTLGTTFDPAGLTKTKNVAGQKIGYAYDAAGEMVSETSPWGALGYSYDQLGNLTTESRSNGVTSTYGYDAVGDVTSIVHQTPKTGALPTSSAATVAKWDGSQAIAGDAPVCSTKNPVAGYLANRTVPGTAVSGCEQSSTYLADAELPTLASPLKPGQSLSYAYTYDLAGNVTNQTQTTGTKSVATSYGYDRLDRLTADTATDGTTNTYAYDEAGNRTNWVTNKAPDTGKKLAVTAVFDAANELVSQVRARSTGTTNVSYGYDGAGERTSQKMSGASHGSTTYAYTGAGQLAKVTQGQVSTSYRYDGLGRNLDTRVTGGAGAGTTTSLWDGQAIVQQSSRFGTGSSTDTMVRDALGAVAVQSSAPGGASNGPAWTLQDRQGSSVAQVNPSGAVTDVTNYSDFGVAKFTTTGWSSATGYTGETTDATTGLNNYFARSYDPMAATWLTADSQSGSATNSQSQNRYAYAGGNPTTNVDTLGYSFLSDLWGTVTSAVVSVAKKVGAAVRSVFSSSVHAVSTIQAQAAQQLTKATTAVAGAAKAFGKSLAKTASAASKWVARHAQQIDWRAVLSTAITVAAVVGTVAAAAACVASVVCGVAAGIAIGVGIGVVAGAAAYAAENAGTKKFTADGLVTAVVVGGASGLVGGAVGEVIGKVAGIAGPVIAKAVSGAVAKAGAKAAATAGVDGAEALASTGGKDAAQSCLNSFPADTPVVMADGTSKPIKDVKVGDRVLATDPETSRTEGRPVQALIRHSGAHVLVDLRFSDGATLTATDHHPIWDDTTQTFVDAIDIQVGDAVLTDTGTTITVTGTSNQNMSMTAYNLQVDTIHTYYVGVTPVLVHNSCVADLNGNAGDIVVLGRLPDTQVAQPWAGHAVLKVSDDIWSPEFNDAFIYQAIAQKRAFYLASEPKGNLFLEKGERAGLPTVFSTELKILTDAGYVRSGDYMVPR